MLGAQRAAQSFGSCFVKKDSAEELLSTDINGIFKTKT
jgi:hypothetical protein